MLLHLSSLSAQDIRATSVQHSHGRASEQFRHAAHSICERKDVSKMNMPTKVMKTLSLGKPSIHRYGRWAVKKRLHPPDKEDMC
jgi:hypothetical protein